MISIETDWYAMGYEKKVLNVLLFPRVGYTLSPKCP
jgi:hypothetical protein